MDIIVKSLEQSFLSFQVTAQVFSYVWFIILPVTFFYIFTFLWLDHIQNKYAGSLDWMLLEVIPPNNIEKSPKPMEALYVGMAGVESSLNPKDTWIDGKFPDSFSLEMVSDGGEMHFYIRTLKKYRHLVEAHLYSQYPDIEVNEVSDYVNDIPKIVPNKQWDLWGTDFEFVKHDAYPIKTYKAFAEDITGKMIDPLASLAEVMSKLPPGQKLWFQLIISPLSPAWGKETGRKLIDKLKGKEVVKVDPFEKFATDIKDVFLNIFTGWFKPTEFTVTKKKEDAPLDTRLTPGERDVFKAVEDNLGKLQFGTKMRFIYVGKKSGFDKSFVSSFIGGIKQFNDDNLNGVKPNDSSKTYANFIFTKTRLRYRQRKLIRRYRSRSRDGEAKVTLSTEELATLFHLPDMQVLAPSVRRIDAKKGGAPSNLPIE
jgi:hypothetical protein